MGIDELLDEALTAVRDGDFGRLVELMEEVKTALERQVPKWLNPDKDYYAIGRCPVCDAIHFDRSVNYCSTCGQRLDMKKGD